MPTVYFTVSASPFYVMLAKVSAVFTNMFHDNNLLTKIIVLLRLFVNSLDKTLLKYSLDGGGLWTILID